MKFDVVTFGSAVKDVFVGTDLAEQGKFIAYPTGSKILIKELRYDIGGGGTNTAVAFSRFGLKTGFIGKIGVDGSGEEILEMLKRENVKFLGSVDKKWLTGFSVILDSKDNNRTVLTYKGINDFIKLRDIKLKKLKTEWLYCSSMLGESLDTQISLARKLKIKGAKIAYNPSSYLTDRRNLIEPLLSIADVLIMNKEEAAMLTRKKDLLKGLHDISGGTIVITDKNKKINAYDGVKKYSLMPNKVKAKERTGAGDAFASGFVAGRIAGMSIKESMELGLRESESVIRYFGAKNNLLKINLKKIKRS
jgi:ribokinase